MENQEYLLGGKLIKDLKGLAVSQRPGKHHPGRWFQLSDYKSIEASIRELAPGACSHNHRHNTEAVCYILAGKGYTVMQQDGGEPERYEWAEGDLFAAPKNWWHQHFNLDPDRPVRYLAVTNVGILGALGLENRE